MTALHPRLPHWLASIAASLLLVACGGGGGGAPAPAPSATTSPPSTTTTTPTAGAAVSSSVAAGPNVLPVLVDRGVNGNAINSPYVTVTVCQPGTQVCQDIDHVLVDTGSTGLRLTAAVAASLSLPAVVTTTGTVGECAHFASGFTWGAVRRADIRLASQTAPNAPIQVIGDAGVPAAPTACSGSGGSLEASGAAKGILGVGLFTQDCGPACATSTSPQIYFSCTTDTCTSTRLATTSQVTNPVSLLPTDNNGVVLVLPAVPNGGVVSATGALVLGIGTQGNNQLGSATVLTTDLNGYFRTTYNGTSYARSFLDSGSNGFFFHDGTLKTCTNSTDFFCPDAPLALTATQVSATGVSRDVAFTIESVDALPGNAAAGNIGGDAGAGLPQSFDWGLPFFYGRTVFTAISGASTPAGPGPFWAW